MDGKYILTGGEDDLVQVWSMEDHKVVAWGEGHNSWVSLFAIRIFCHILFIPVCEGSSSFFSSTDKKKATLSGQWCGL